MKKNLFNIAVEAEQICLESYAVRFDKLMVKQNEQELAKLKLRKQISLEGFFDIFKSKEKEIKESKTNTEDDSVYELLDLISMELEEVTLKLKKDNINQIDITTDWFGKATAPAKIISIAKEYEKVSEYILNYYKLELELAEECFHLLNSFKSDKQDNFKSKVIDFLNKRTALCDINKLFQGFKQNKQYNANKNLIQLLDNEESICLYAPNGILVMRDRKWSDKDIDEEDDTPAISYLGTMPWLSIRLVRMPARTISFSQKQYIELLNILKNVFKNLMHLDKEYIINHFGDNMHALMHKLSNISSSNTVIKEVVDDLLSGIYDGQDLGEDFQQELIKVCDSVLRIKL